MAATRVLVVDIHPIVRDAVGATLSAAGGFEVVGSAASGQDALHRAWDSRPDVVVQEMDLAGPGDGAWLCQAVRGLPWPVRVVVYAADPAGQCALTALSVGADSYLRKTAELDVLADTVRRTHQGERLWLLGGQEASGDYRRVPVATMTGREQQVLGLVLRRYSNDEIAVELDLSPQTVRGHVSSLLRKLGVANRRELFGQVLVPAGRTW